MTIVPFAPSQDFSGAEPPNEPPNNVEAEQALLAAILINNTAYDRVLDFLKPEHFYAPAHQVIYGTIAAMIGSGRSADPVTIKHCMEGDGTWDSVGGAEYVKKLALSAITIINARDYGLTVLDCWRRRQIIDAAEAAIAASRSPKLEHGSLQVVVDTQRRLAELEAAGEGGGHVVSLAHAAGRAIEASDRAYKADTQLLGISTGFRELDTLTGGLIAGNVIVLAGRSGMCKSLLAGKITAHAAASGHPVYIQSLEMSAEDWTQRLLSERVALPVQQIRRGALDLYAFDQMQDAQREWIGHPLYIDDESALTWEQIRSRIRRAHERWGARVAVVDHVNIVRLPKGARADQMRLELGLMASGAKALAKQLGMTIILLSQLNKSIDARDDRRPTLRDLAESGELETNADIVALLYREERYLSRENPVKGVAETEEKWAAKRAAYFVKMEECRGRLDVFVDKNRAGAEGSVKLRADLAVSRIADWSEG